MKNIRSILLLYQRRRGPSRGRVTDSRHGAKRTHAPPRPRRCIVEPHAADHDQPHRRRRGLPRRFAADTRLRRGHGGALHVSAAGQPAQRRRRRAQAQGLLRERDGGAGRGAPRLRPLRRQADAEGAAARGADPRMRRRRGQARRRRRLADRGEQSGEPLLATLPARPGDQHPRLRPARRGRGGTAR